MEVPYRCPHCHALLSRNKEFAKLMATLPDENHSYSCGSCGHWMKASIVQAGLFDIDISPSQVTPLNHRELPSLSELLAHLKREHRDDYVYRGQTKMWNRPLVPSIFRRMISRKPIEAWSPSMRLRELGSVFHDLLPNEEIHFDQDNLDKRLLVNDYLRQLFGFVLGQILAQQCSISSEGLDVTDDPDVAAFFSVFDFSTREFVERGTGVIYRFELPDADRQVGNLNNYNFYSCPPYISAERILAQIEHCDSWDSAMKSFTEYMTTYGLANINEPRPKRPFDVLRLPKLNLMLSRVVQQGAGLLIPDMILSQMYLAINNKPPDDKAQKSGQSALEDLETRKGTQVFRFLHTERSKFVVPRSPQILFPKDDPLVIMLRTFLSRLTPTFAFLTEAYTVYDPGGFDLVK